jgi:acyl dehydratase
MKTLDSSPSILPLYLKAALPLVPGASALPFVPGGSDEIPPGLGFELSGVSADPKQVAGYAKVCGFPLKETLPPTFPHILAFPLHMAVMSDPSFPFGAVGLVHIGNAIEQARPIAADETLDIRVSSTPLQPHPKGRTFSLLTEVSVGGEIVWSETSTMLHRGKPTESEVAAPADEFPSLDAEVPASATWKLPGDLGRRYGAVSGDRNPIHMHALTAKPLGFNSAIAHGMWTKARALAQLENRLPDSFRAEVRFRRPIFLPAKVEFASLGEGVQIRFSVRDARKGTPHLDGLIRANSPQTPKASTLK